MLAQKLTLSKTDKQTNKVKTLPPLGEGSLKWRSQDWGGPGVKENKKFRGAIVLTGHHIQLTIAITDSATTVKFGV